MDESEEKVMYPIEKLIQDWCNKCNVVCMTRLNYKDKIINIITNRPGIMIGYKGNLINKYREKIKEYGWEIDIMEAQEIHYPGDDWEKIIDERVLGYIETEEIR